MPIYLPMLILCTNALCDMAILHRRPNGSNLWVKSESKTELRGILTEYPRPHRWSVKEICLDLGAARHPCAVSCSLLVYIYEGSASADFCIKAK